MTYSTLKILFYISIVFGLIIGILLFIWWTKKIKKKIFNTKAASIARTFFYILPGIIMFIIACVPCLYSNYLLKQYNYCKQVIEVNKGIDRNASIIQERCSCFDLNELFKNQE